MTTVEIPEKKWEQFCHRLQEVCRGAKTSIQLVQSDGAISSIAREAPLQTVALDKKTDACNTLLVIEAGLANEKPIRHVVLEPIHIRLKTNGDAGRYNHLHLMAETGTTILEIHPGLNSDVVKEFE
jgi:hypothetical protein